MESIRKRKPAINPLEQGAREGESPVFG